MKIKEGCYVNPIHIKTIQIVNNVEGKYVGLGWDKYSNLFNQKGDFKEGYCILIFLDKEMIETTDIFPTLEDAEKFANKLILTNKIWKFFDGMNDIINILKRR